MNEAFFVYRKGDVYHVLEMTDEGKKEYFSDEDWESWEGWANWSGPLRKEEVISFLTRKEK